MGLANCLYLTENFDQSIKLFEEVAAFKSSDEIEYNLGNCYYMKGEIDEAIYHYNESIQFNDKKSDAYYNLGNAYCIKEQFKEALNCFK